MKVSAPHRGWTSVYALRRVGAKDYSSAPLTEPDVRATHPALWIDISEVQRELNRNLRAVKPRRRRDRSFSCASLFATESFAARMRPSAHPFRPPKGCRQHEAQLSGSRLSQSISSLALLAFNSLLATMRRSDFCVGVVPSSLPPSGLPLEADPRRPPWVMTLDVPPLPPPLPLRPRMDFGRRVRRHADPAGPACSGVHSRSVLRFASGFFPTRPRGASAGVSRRQGLRAVASGSRLLPPRPAKDFHLQSSAHARHTFDTPYAAETANPAGRHLSFAEICPDDRDRL